MNIKKELEMKFKLKGIELRKVISHDKTGTVGRVYITKNLIDNYVIVIPAKRNTLKLLEKAIKKGEL